MNCLISSTFLHLRLRHFYFRCTIKEIRDYEFVKELKPYLKHSDAEVKKKAQTIIKKLQEEQASYKMSQVQQQQQHEEEMDELFGDD